MPSFLAFTGLRVKQATSYDVQDEVTEPFVIVDKLVISAPSTIPLPRWMNAVPPGRASLRRARDQLNCLRFQADLPAIIPDHPYELGCNRETNGQRSLIYPPGLFVPKPQPAARRPSPLRSILCAEAEIHEGTQDNLETVIISPSDSAKLLYDCPDPTGTYDDSLIRAGSTPPVDIDCLTKTERILLALAAASGADADSSYDEPSIYDDEDLPQAAEDEEKIKKLAASSESRKPLRPMDAIKLRKRLLACGTLASSSAPYHSPRRVARRSAAHEKENAEGPRISSPRKRAIR